jgi:hypothetical protein
MKGLISTISAYRVGAEARPDSVNLPIISRRLTERAGINVMGCANTMPDWISILTDFFCFEVLIGITFVVC